jgi:hypothetical protein
VAGRALVFSNPKIVRLLQTVFVPYAGDQWYLHRRQDTAGEFFWRVAQQGHNRDRPLDETRQGVYAAAPDGTMLGSINSWSPERTLAMLEGAMTRWRQLPKETPVPTLTGAADERFVREPPAGGLILNVFTRIPLPPPPGQAWTPNMATGRDHMWLTRDEWRSLLPREWKPGARYPLPRAVAERLVRFHLLDDVRGEPSMWEAGRDVRQADLWLRVEDAAARHLHLEGTARMQSPANGGGTERGYDARVQGTLVYDPKADRFTRFDLLAWGEAWGEGRYTGGPPKGRFPLVIALSLAGNSPADRVPPQGIRGREGYFGTGGAERAGR